MIEGRSERAGPGLLSIATLAGFPAVKLGVHDLEKSGGRKNIKGTMKAYGDK